MHNYNAEDLDVSFVLCAVCDKGMKGGQWFARIRQGDWMVALCCPLCTSTFEDDPQPYVRRIQSLEKMGSPDGPFRQEPPPA